MELLVLLRILVIVYISVLSKKFTIGVHITSSRVKYLIFINDCCTLKENIFLARLTEIVHKEARKSKSYVKLCELSTPVSRRDYFMKKVQAANGCINSGDHETSIELLIRAMAVCSRPAALLQCMSTSLPISVYRKLIERLSNLT